VARDDHDVVDATLRLDLVVTDENVMIIRACGMASTGGGAGPEMN
jgi:hypothetical protein